MSALSEGPTEETLNNHRRTPWDKKRRAAGGSKSQTAGHKRAGYEAPFTQAPVTTKVGPPRGKSKLSSSKESTGSNSRAPSTSADAEKSSTAKKVVAGSTAEPPAVKASVPKGQKGSPLATVKVALGRRAFLRGLAESCTIVNEDDLRQLLTDIDTIMEIAKGHDDWSTFDVPSWASWQYKYANVPKSVVNLTAKHPELELFKNMLLPLERVPSDHLGAGSIFVAPSGDMLGPEDSSRILLGLLIFARSFTGKESSEVLEMMKRALMTITRTASTLLRYQNYPDMDWNRVRFLLEPEFKDT